MLTYKKVWPSHLSHRYGHGGPRETLLSPNMIIVQNTAVLYHSVGVRMGLEKLGALMPHPLCTVEYDRSKN